MACRFEVTLPGEDGRHIEAAQAALAEVDRLEAALTVFRETSEVSQVNAAAGSAPVAVGAWVLDLVQRSLDLHSATGGAFDVTTTPLSRAWGFLRREGRLPSVDEVDRARSTVGMDKVVLDHRDRTVRFTAPGVELNFGSIGKGYALDWIAGLLRDRGVSRALLSAGGSSVLAMGGGAEGFMIDVRSRRSRRGVLARLRLRDAALATSGAGEQYFEVEGRRYGHVIDPRSGRPASGVLGASVITGDAASADALSTAFLIGGSDLARRYCDAHPETLAVLVLDEPGERTDVFGRYSGATLEMLT
jgi:thiamine biosynthesis lipoprotein